MAKAVFLDKDGVLVDNSCYPEPPKTKLLKQAIEGIILLGGLKQKYDVFIVSNQPWISKGVLKKEQVEQIFAELRASTEILGLKIKGHYYCPHKKADNCTCKKPSSELILKAAKEHNINLTESYLIGDMTSDILAGKNAGCKTILVLTGVGGRDNEYFAVPDFVCDNLSDAVKIIIHS